MVFTLHILSLSQSVYLAKSFYKLVYTQEATNFDVPDWCCYDLNLMSLNIYLQFYLENLNLENLTGLWKLYVSTQVDLEIIDMLGGLDKVVLDGVKESTPFLNDPHISSLENLEFPYVIKTNAM